MGGGGGSSEGETEVSWGPGYEEVCLQQGGEFELHGNAMESSPSS